MARLRQLPSCDERSAAFEDCPTSPGRARAEEPEWEDESAITRPRGFMIPSDELPVLPADPAEDIGYIVDVASIEECVSNPTADEPPRLTPLNDTPLPISTSGVREIPCPPSRRWTRMLGPLLIVLMLAAGFAGLLLLQTAS